MKLNSLCALLGMSVLVSACAVGPDYKRPDTALMNQVLLEAPSDWKLATPNDEQFKGLWWEKFQDPQLNSLIEQLNQNNQTLKAAYANYRVAEANLQAVRSSFFPKVGASASSQRNSSNISVVGGNTVGVISETKTVGLDVSWEVDLWGKLRRSAEASEAQLAGSAADLANVRLSLQASLTQTYIAWQVSQQQLVLAQRSVQAYERTLKIVENKYHQGLVTQADVWSARSQLGAAQASFYDYDLSRRQAEHAIATLMGLAPAQLHLEPVALMSVPTLPDVFSTELLERRPDIASAERQVMVANANIGVAKAAFFPSLSLSASGGSTAKKIADLFTSPAEVWSLGGSLLVSIFDAGARSAQVDAAKAQYDAAVASYRQTVLTGLKEVEDNLAATQLLAKENEQQRKSVLAAQEAARVAKANFSAGVTDYTSLATAEVARMQADVSMAQLKARQLNAYLNLVVALGGGWDAQSSTK